MSGDIVKICYLGDPLISTETIQSINDMDGVMYIAKLKFTKEKDVLRTIRISKEADAKVCGCIIIP